MLIGTAGDDIEIIRLIESLGGNVVIDDHCTGSRYFWNQVVHEKDQLSALASRYINKPLCPIRDLDVNVRLGHIWELIKDYNVRGVIFLQQRFCDPMEYDISYMQPPLEEKGIHTLTLELDVINPLGQFRTRIEAFLEMLQPTLV